MNLKALPNMVSIIRILLSAVLALLPPLSVMFFTFYFICGLSDVLDGCLARRLRVENRAGALLDSLADLVFCLALFVTVFRCFKVPGWLLFWIIMLAVFRLIAWVISLKKHKGLIPHTYSDKVVGILLFFLLPLVTVFETGLILPGAIICILASFATVELLAIGLSSKEVTQETRSYFS